jgi:hypothetical protein
MPMTPKQRLEVRSRAIKAAADQLAYLADGKFFGPSLVSSLQLDLDDKVADEVKHILWKTYGELMSFKDPQLPRLGAIVKFRETYDAPIENTIERIEAGEEGTVDHICAEMYVVKLHKPHHGLSDYDNTVQFHVDMYGNVLERDTHVATLLEVVAPR